MSTVPDGDRHDDSPDDDTLARFREIMEREFGEQAAAVPPPQAEPATNPYPFDDLTGVAPAFNLSEALERVEPDEPDEPFEPPAPEPLPRPTGRALVGTVLGVGGLLVVLAGMFGANLPLHASSWALGCLVVGLLLLFSCIPNTPRDPSDDGARV